MIRDATLFFALLVGMGMFAYCSWMTWEAKELLDCRRQHNVYTCTLQAVPVAQPSWVSNGESE